MMKGSSRDKRALLAEKAPRTKVGTGVPNKVEGNDGDLQVRQINNKIKLFVKYKGIWHGVNVGKSFDKVEKKSEDALTSKDLFSNRNQVATNDIVSDADFSLDTSGRIELNSDSGTVIIKDGLASHFLFDCDNTTLTIYDDASPLDYLRIAVDDNGVSTISTNDNDGTSGLLRLIPNGNLVLDPSTGNIVILTSDKLYFDGGTHTYINENFNSGAGDILDFYVGGINMFRLDEANGVIDFKGDNLRLVAEDGSTYAGSDGHSLQTKTQINAGQNIQIAEVTVSDSECNALHTTAKTIVAAQGADKVIFPTSAYLFVEHGGTPQGASGADMFISWNGGTTSSTTIFYLRRFFYGEASDRIYKSEIYNGEAGQSLTAGDNQPLTIKLDSAVTTDSIDSIKVVVSYFVYDNG